MLVFLLLVVGIVVVVIAATRKGAQSSTSSSSESPLPTRRVYDSRRPSRRQTGPLKKYTPKASRSHASFPTSVSEAGSQSPGSRTTLRGLNRSLRIRLEDMLGEFEEPAARSVGSSDDGHEFWVAADQASTIRGYDLEGGRIYVGSGLRSVHGSWSEIEPALIDPKLPVDRSRPDRAGDEVSYWPSYAHLSAAGRAAYLEWLASGRRDPQTYIGYVFLFFYGLERRVMWDLRRSETGNGEVDGHLAEVERLLSLYGNNDSFSGYARQFLAAAKLLHRRETLVGEVPKWDPQELRVYGLPFSLQVTLGRHVGRKEPIPAEAALSWYRHAPETRALTPANRCPEEFRWLFLQRYPDRFANGGLKVRPPKKRLEIAYRSASSSIRGRLEIPLAEDLPDVSVLTAPVRELQSFADEICSELDSYSRYVGRSGDVDSPLALSLLPPDLAALRDGKESRALTKWLKDFLRQGDLVPISASELVARWPSKNAGRLTKREAEGLVSYLASRDLGIEPDVRRGAPALHRTERAILFHQPWGNEPEEASRELLDASLVLSFAAIVSAADGQVSEAEKRHLAAHLEDGLLLEAGERKRLEARLEWLLLDPPSLATVRKAVEPLTEVQRHELAQFLITVAGADGRIDAQEIEALEKIYRLLGLDRDAVFRDVHGLASGEPTLSEGPPPATTPEGSAPAKTAKQSGTITLDLEKVQAKKAETRDVASMLGEIFEEAGDEPPADGTEGSETEAPSSWVNLLAGLDEAHSELLRRLSSRPTWTREEWEPLATELDLMPDGALETINEAAFETCGDPLIEGLDLIHLDGEILRDLLENTEA